AVLERAVDDVLARHPDERDLARLRADRKEDRDHEAAPVRPEEGEEPRECLAVRDSRPGGECAHLLLNVATGSYALAVALREPLRGGLGGRSVRSSTVLRMKYRSVYRAHIVSEGYLRWFAVNEKIIAVNRDGVEESKPIDKAGTRARYYRRERPVTGESIDDI